jgi:outer membrane protein assembly factor BamB
MNKFFFFFLSATFLIFSTSHSQTFNKRFVVSELSEGRCIISNELGLFVISVGYNNENFLSCHVSFDIDGDVINSQCFGESEPFSYGFIPNADAQNQFGDELMSLHSFIFPEGIGGMSYNLFNNEGVIVREHRWLSSFYEEESGPESALALMRDAILLEDGTIFVSYDGSTDQTLTKLDAGVICFDENDELVWETQWVTADNEIPFALTYHENYLFVSVMRNPSNLVVDGSISIYKLNAITGEILDSWHEPWGFDLTELDEIISVEDGIVMAGSALLESNEFSDGCVIKINADGENLWHAIIDNPDPNFRGYFTEVVQTTDGNYVAAGEWEYSLPEFDEVNGNSNDDGWLVKFDAQTGDIIWDRKYHYIEDTNDEHEIYDLTACSDGGVAFVGEALDLTINGDPDYIYPVQQGWVVKVDSFGCIVPGCQENSISELNAEKTYFKAGPNPLAQGQNLHIYLGNEATGTFSLRDAQGKEIKSFSAQGKNTTYTWELDIPAGSYVLSLVDGNGALQSQKIIIN